MREQHPIALHYYEHSALKKFLKKCKNLRGNALNLPSIFENLRMKQLAGRTEEIT